LRIFKFACSSLTLGSCPLIRAPPFKQPKIYRCLLRFYITFDIVNKTI
jgi:hypothetical protein